jgi:hypothetical protein
MREVALSRKRLLIALALVVPLGFATKFYRGAGQELLNSYVGGVFYEVFWVFAILLGKPSLAPGRVALGVFLVTCALEVLQLWRPPMLEAVRATFLGRTLIGTTFSWWDFPCYATGCLAAVGLCAWMRGAVLRKGPGKELS